MDLYDLKKKNTREALGLNENFNRIYAFIDFANVNYWFEEDRHDSENKALLEKEKLSIGIKELCDFSNLFSIGTRFYYGHDPKNERSLRFLTAAKKIYGKHRVFTKPVQKIKHYLAEQEVFGNTRTIEHDKGGNFIRIPKCNFDVEICVDAIRLLENYDTFCLFSSDADFVHLARFLKSKNKKIILVKGGYIHHSLHEISDLIINAQDIKKHIAIKKQKPGN